MCSMAAQMSIVSMYAVYARWAFDLDSLHVGFATSLGAIASVATNIWVSPKVNDRFGNAWASITGSLMVALGALLVLEQPLQVSLLGLMIAYQGMAINASAVACGGAALTDAQNRSTVMTGVRMLKSLGAVAGPIVSGILAGTDPRLPFVAAAAAALLAAMMQLAALRATEQVQALILGRRAVGLESALLGPDGWQDEYGTPEEIRDLGEFVADLLTKRHYRWVTYNHALKKVLIDFFPPLPIESEQEHREGYDWVRERARSICSQGLMLHERGA